MNIFYLNETPKQCAEEHLDKHCVKMILEYAQLLSTAHRVLDGTPYKQKSPKAKTVQRYMLPKPREDVLYKACHINHPSAVWVRQSQQNYIWLANLLVALCEEYTYRYGKTHKVVRDGLCYALLNVIPTNIPDKPFTEPTPAMPDDVKVINDSLASYRNYYIKNKTHLANWKNRPVPSWYLENIRPI